jgi:hypothetical protein
MGLFLRNMGGGGAVQFLGKAILMKQLIYMYEYNTNFQCNTYSFLVRTLLSPCFHIRGIYSYLGTDLDHICFFCSV